MNNASRRSPVAASTLSSVSESSQDLTEMAKDEAPIGPESRSPQRRDAPVGRDHAALKTARKGPAHGRGILKPNLLPGAGSAYGAHEQRRRLPVDKDNPKDSQQSIHQEPLEAAKQLRSDGGPPAPMAKALFTALPADESALPLAKRKRVSIDPHPTVDIVTPDMTSSPPPQVPLRTVPQRRFPADDGCSASRAAQLYKHLSEAAAILGCLLT
ncbi:uncharacterized protein LOC144102221 [Amblyomma americanum]